MSFTGVEYKKDSIVWPLLNGFPINGRQILGDSLPYINEGFQGINLATIQANSVLIGLPEGNYAAKHYGDMLTWSDSSAMWLASASPSLDSSYTLRLTRAFAKLLVWGNKTDGDNSGPKQPLVDEQINVASVQYVGSSGDTLQVFFTKPMGSTHYCVVASGSLRTFNPNLGMSIADTPVPFDYNTNPIMGKSAGIQVFDLTSAGFKLKWPGLKCIASPLSDFVISFAVFSYWYADPREIEYKTTLKISYTKNETPERYARNNDAAIIFTVVGAHRQNYLIETSGTYSYYGIISSGQAVSVTGMDANYAGTHTTKIRDLLFGTSWKFTWAPGYGSGGSLIAPEGLNGTDTKFEGGIGDYNLSFAGEDVY